MNKEFTVILGEDGIGKTTVIRKAQVIEENIELVQWSTWSYIITQNFRYPYGETDVGKGVEGWSPEARSVALSALIQMSYVQGVLESTKPFILVDSFYYRFLSKESVLKKCSSEFLIKVETLPIPSQAIVFESNPALAWERKQGIIRKSEYLHKPTREDFCNFQKLVHAQYVSKLNSQDVPIIWLNPEDSVENNAIKVVKQVKLLKGG